MLNSRTSHSWGRGLEALLQDWGLGALLRASPSPVVALCIKFIIFLDINVLSFLYLYISSLIFIFLN